MPSLGDVHQQIAADVNPFAQGLRFRGKTLEGVAPRGKGRGGALGRRGRLGIYIGSVSSFSLRETLPAAWTIGQGGGEKPEV